MAAKDLTGINTLKFDVRASRTGSNLKFGLHNTERVDQSNTTVNNSFQLGDVSGKEYRQGQSFTLTTSLTITGAEVHRRNPSGGGTPTGNWTYRIETDNSGVPSGTLVNDSASIVVTPPTTGNSKRGTFATPFTLTAGQYWLVINCDNQSNGNFWGLSLNTTSVYAGGNNAMSENGVWTAYVNYELWFKIYGDMTTETTPNITSADTFQTVTVDISGVADANKNAIDTLTITVVDATAANTFYVDNFRTTVENTKSFTDDAFAITEPSIKKASTRPFAVETMNITESIIREQSRSFLDIFNITDLMPLLRGLIFLDTVTLNEEFSKLGIFAKTFLEDITTTEIYSRSAAIIYAFNENITTTEDFKKVMTKLFSEIASLSDLFVKAQGKLWLEIVTLTEVAAKNVTWTISEIITLADTLARIWSIPRLFTDNITLSELFSCPLKWLRESHLGAAWVKASKVATTWTQSVKSSTAWTKTTGALSAWSKLVKPSNIWQKKTRS